jgi:hypothetical protein
MNVRILLSMFVFSGFVLYVKYCIVAPRCFPIMKWVTAHYFWLFLPLQLPGNAYCYKLTSYPVYPCHGNVDPYASTGCARQRDKIGARTGDFTCMHA